MAKKITAETIDDEIAAEAFHVFPGNMVTVCLITLKDGRKVVGECACASPAEFDQEGHRNAAREHARSRILTSKFAKEV